MSIGLRSSILRPAAALLLAVTPALARCGREEAGRLVVRPERIDFGTIVHGDRLEREIELSNESGRPLLVESARANCACFVIGSFQHALQPGERVTIPVSIDSSAVPPGEVHGKEIAIVSNDRVAPRIQVPVAGVIRGLRLISPRLLTVGDLVAGRPSEHVVHVRPDEGVRLELVSAEVMPRGLFDVETTPAEGGADVTVRLRPDATGTGPLSAALVLKTRVELEGGGERRFEDQVRLLGRWTQG